MPFKALGGKFFHNLVVLFEGQRVCGSLFVSRACIFAGCTSKCWVSSSILYLRDVLFGRYEVLFGRYEVLFGRYDVLFGRYEVLFGS